MKRNKIAAAVALIVAAPGISTAAVTINQSGATHVTNWTQNGGANADILVNQGGDIAHNVNIIQAGTPAEFNIEVNQNGDFIGNNVNIRQIKTNPRENSILVNQDGNDLDVNIQAIGDTASTDTPNDYTVDQTGESQEVDIISQRSSGDLVSVSQAGIGQKGTVRLIDVESATVTIDQDGADNQAEADISISRTGGAGPFTTTATIGQTGTANFAKLTSFLDKSSSVSIDQSDDSNDGRVFLYDTTGTTVGISQNVEGDNNSATLTVRNSEGSNISATQQGDNNEAISLVRGDDGSIVLISQADSDNTARANVLNNSTATVSIDQTADGDLNDAVIIVRESNGSNVSVTQDGNEHVADVFLKDDDGSMVSVTQSLGQNQAGVSVEGGLNSTLTVNQSGRLGIVDIAGDDIDSAIVVVMQDSSSFENTAIVSLNGATGTAATIDQSGELNVSSVIGSISDTNSLLSIIQADDANMAGINMQESANLSVALSQGAMGGDENLALVDLVESNRTDLTITQNGNNNAVGSLAPFEFQGDRGSVVAFNQADDGNSIDGSIVESRFELNVSQGLTGGDDNEAFLGVDNANQTVVNINQNDNMNVAMLDIQNDFDSVVSITQSNLGVAHSASISMNDTQDGNFSIEQSGLNHMASISATDVLGASAVIVQSGGSGNTSVATLVNGDDGVALTINQIDCFQCSATADSGNRSINQL
ncbi:beta strand repeat-containing protein [Granulosicoccus sp. 3-233]|uniref:beta strand repeat-containing protein n=1 Tax=Granulosicoccus sp. 3-233 TaxID=3417969 RepID=UPI003D32BB37